MSRMSILGSICLAFLCVFHTVPSFAKPNQGEKKLKTEGKRNSAKNKRTRMTRKTQKRRFAISVKRQGVKAEKRKNQVPFTSAEKHCKKELKRAKEQAVFATVALRSCQKTLKAKGAASKKQRAKLSKQVQRILRIRDAAERDHKRRTARACKRDGLKECDDIIRNRMTWEFDGHIDAEAVQHTMEAAIKNVCEVVIEKACAAIKN